MLLLAAAGCEQQSETLLVGHAIADEHVAELTFGRSTADDVERIFGAPDQRDADGTLVYRATEMRRSSRGIAGLAWASDEEEVGTHVAKFRFADGKLSQICRERS